MFRTLMTSRRSGESPNILVFSLRALWRVLATTRPGATRPEVQTWMKAKGAAEFMHPSSVVVLEAIPVLGSGKTNYVALAKALSDSGA
jgi:non-ribosomal peptide synthetase component E (peptide arylation enzyme)